MPRIVRATGSLLICSLVKFVAIWVVSKTAAATGWPETLTSSLTLLTERSASVRVVSARMSLIFCVTVVSPCSSKVTV